MNRFKQLFALFKKCQKGVVAIEMAFIGPFMLLLYFGLLDLTYFMTENRKTIAVAGSVADLVGQHRRAIYQSDLTDYLKIGKMIMKPHSDDNLRIQVTAYRKSGSTLNVVWSKNNGKGLACTNTVPGADIMALMELNNDVVVTQTCTKIKLYSGKLLTFYKPDKSDFDVENFAMIRPRVALTLECYASSSTFSGPSTC
jgi:Flp pilus assembly protein TadG